MTLSMSAKPSASAAHLQLVGSNILVVLELKGDGVVLAEERADFMPADHSPICRVTGFDDPQVVSTLKAVQEARVESTRRAGLDIIGGKDCDDPFHGGFIQLHH